MSQFPPNPNRPSPIAPLQPLATSAHIPYASPAFERKPGLVTAIGVCSIVFGAIGILFSAAVSLMLFGMVIFVAQSKALTVSSATASPTVTSNGAPVAEVELEEAVDNGNNARQRFIAVLDSLQRLTTSQKNRLGVLLEEHQARILTVSPEAVSDESLKGLVSESGTQPDSQGRSVVYYELGTGRLEASVDDVIFFPTNNGRALRASEVVQISNALTETQAKEVCDKVTQLAGPQATVQQIAAIRKIVLDPKQTLLNAGQMRNGQKPADWVYMASMSGPNLTVMTFNGGITLDPNGRKLASPVLAPRGPALFTRAVSPVPAALGLIGGLSSVALAIYLLVIGIMTTQGSRKGRSLHFIYAILKLTCLVALTVCISWTTSEMTNAMNVSTGTAPTWNRILSGTLAWLWIPGAAYPIALLIVLNTKPVKDYFLNPYAAT